jgi:hypothetical protein
MTLARLLAAALVICSALSFAQTKTDSLTISDQAAATSVPAMASSSEPWKFIPTQRAEPSAAKSPMDRLQIDQYKLFRSKTDSRTLLVGPEADAGMILSGLDGDTDGVTTCLKIRSYVVARDSKDSESTHLVSYSTCQPSSRYQLKTTEIRIEPVNR